MKYAHMGLCNLCNVSISRKTKKKQKQKNKQKNKKTNHQSEKMITMAIHTGNVQMLRAKELQVKTNAQSSDWLHVHRSYIMQYHCGYCKMKYIAVRVCYRYTAATPTGATIQCSSCRVPSAYPFSYPNSTCSSHSSTV